MASLSLFSPAGAYGNPPLPENETEQAPDEGRYINREAPDILIHTGTGEEMRLSRLWSEMPVLLTLLFTKCTGTCSPLVSSLTAAVDRTGGIGKHYRVVVLSFDPEDRPADVAAAAVHHGVGENPDWIFGVASPGEVKRLADAIGFWYRWDNERKQYDHPSVVAAIDRGRVARLLVGVDVSPSRLREVVRELSGEFVPSYPLPGKALFRCFSYDPESGRVYIAWGFLLLIVPGALAIAVTLWIFLPRRTPRVLPALPRVS